MTKTEQTNPSGDQKMMVRIPADLRQAMADYRRTAGMPQAEMVRRALRDWLIKVGALAPTQPADK